MKKSNIKIIVFAIIGLIVILVIRGYMKVNGDICNLHHMPHIKFSNPIIIKDSADSGRVFIANMPTDDIKDIENLYPVVDFDDVETTTLLCTDGTKQYFRIKNRRKSYNITYWIKPYSPLKRINPESYNAIAEIELIPKWVKCGWISAGYYVAGLKYVLKELYYSLCSYTFKNNLPNCITIADYHWSNIPFFISTDNDHQFIQVFGSIVSGDDDVLFWPIRTNFNILPECEEIGHTEYDSNVKVFKIHNFDVSDFVLELKKIKDWKYEAKLQMK